MPEGKYLREGQTMGESDFWTAQFEGTEKQVAYARDVRDYLSRCIDKLHLDAIKTQNDFADTERICDAVRRGIVLWCDNSGDNGRISAKFFLDHALGLFVLDFGDYSVRTDYDLMRSDEIMRLSRLGGYEGLSVHCDCGEYTVWGTVKRERREYAERRTDNPLKKPSRWVALAAKKRSENSK